MSLTAFNRLRRMKQEEAMKPENIKPAEEVKEEVVEPQTVAVEEKTEETPVEETKTSARRGRRASN